MKNYFSIFSLPITTEIDLDVLEQKYLQFQKEFHPDKASTADIEKSIAVNEAYEVLKNNLSRLSHILQLNGIDLENDSNAPKVDAETLMEVLELREKIFESDSEKIENIKKDLHKKVKFFTEETKKQITKELFAEAAQILIKAKYFNKTLQDLKKRK